MTHIDFETKSDRELLILGVTSINECVDHLARINSTIAKHETRITKLEAGGCGESKSIWRVNWQTITLIASLIALIIIDVASRVKF